MIYIFGFGSLVSSKGINGRRMQHIYTDNDLTECYLNNYERNLNAICTNGFRYFGITYTGTGKINGVIFKITKHDLQPFSESEQIGFAYTLKDVTSLIEGVNLNPNDIIYTCETINHDYKHLPIAPTYLDRCFNFLLDRSHSFQLEFSQLTNWSSLP